MHAAQPRQIWRLRLLLPGTYHHTTTRWAGHRQQGKAAPTLTAPRTQRLHRNPDTSEQGNCLIDKFMDAPIWTVPTLFMHKGHHVTLRPFCHYTCQTYMMLPFTDCQKRAA
jgi:hypothetical protein